MLFLPVMFMYNFHALVCLMLSYELHPPFALVWVTENSNSWPHEYQNWKQLGWHSYVYELRDSLYSWQKKHLLELEQANTLILEWINLQKTSLREWLFLNYHLIFFQANYSCRTVLDNCHNFCTFSNAMAQEDSQA